MRKRDVAGHGKSFGQLSKSARAWMAGLKSSVSHLVTPSGPAPKLIFDQLEPRMLMSADPVVIDLSALHPTQPTHDVVVRLLNEVVTTGDQTVNIERVQAVDANNPATVLSSQVVPTGSNVTVLAGQGNKITLDLSSVPPSTPQPQFSVVGGGGDTLSVIENSTQPVGWHLDGGGAGHIDGAVQVAFTGVDHLVGNGADTLYGSAADTSWSVDGAGSGAVGAIKFDGFGSLAGAAGQNEVFTIASTGSLQGSIDGGGHATIAIAAGATAGWHLDGGGAGHVDGAVQFAFTGVDHLVGSGADTLYGSTTDNNWNWTVDGAGSGEVGAVSFGGFANLVGAASQNNVFTVTSTGSLAGNIDGGGDGTLVLDVGTINNFVSDFTGPHSGSETFGGDTINYTGMLPLINNGTIANVNYQISSNSSASDSVELYYDSTAGDPNAGDMVLKSLNGAFETTFFTAPTGSSRSTYPISPTSITAAGPARTRSTSCRSPQPSRRASTSICSARATIRSTTAASCRATGRPTTA